MLGDNERPPSRTGVVPRKESLVKFQVSDSLTESVNSTAQVEPRINEAIEQPSSKNASPSSGRLSLDYLKNKLGWSSKDSSQYVTVVQQPETTSNVTGDQSSQLYHSAKLQQTPNVLVETFWHTRGFTG